MITVSYLKRLTNTALGRLHAFRMYGGIGMSLHRESTDSTDNICGIAVNTRCSKLRVPEAMVSNPPKIHLPIILVAGI